MDATGWSIVLAHVGGIVIGAHLVLLLQALRERAASAEQRRK
jgi:hypothetical protein